MLEAVLVDGSRLGFDANRTWIRSPVSRSVRDISWAPTWWVLDLLEQEKIGGLVRHSSEWDRYQEMLDGRTHKPFGALRAPVDASDLLTHLCKQLEAFGTVGIESAGDGLTSILAGDSYGRKRLRFTVQPARAPTPAELSELVLHDCASQVNAAAIVAVATAMNSWSHGQALRNRRLVHAIDCQQTEVSGRLTYDAGEARLITEHLHVQGADLNTQGGAWITSAVVPPDLLRRSPFVINF